MKTTEQHFLHTPYTASGKWSLGFVIAMFVLFFAGILLINTLYSSVLGGNTILEDLSLRPMFVVTMLTSMAAGVMALITGVAAIAKQHERTLFVYLSTLFGALLVFILLGEIFVPH